MTPPTRQNISKKKKLVQTNTESKVKISIKDLHKNFNDKKILNGINLDIDEKESLVILGLSGGGKSVLIKSMSSLIKPSSGEIIIDRQNIVTLNKKDRYNFMEKIAFLFQGGALFDSLKIWENIAFRLMQKNISKKDAFDIAMEKIQQVGLAANCAKLYPSELSGGMQKRAALARAIAGMPEIIFFDEPTTGLDPITSDIINELIIKCNKELGATTITITHDLNSAKKIASKIAMLYQGKIIWHGLPEDMYNSGNPIVDQFTHGRFEGPIQSTN